MFKVSNNSFNDFSSSKRSSETNLVLQQAINAFSIQATKHMFVVDFTNNDFFYLSNKLDRLFGYPLDYIKSEGLHIFEELISRTERELYLLFIKKLHEVMMHKQIDAPSSFIASCNIKIGSGKKKRLLNFKLTPLYINDNGVPELLLCTMAPTFAKEFGDFCYYEVGTNCYYRLNLFTTQWEKKDLPIITEEERQILILSSQGYTMEDIANTMAKSIDTIKAYKRKLFKRISVANISEAITFAYNYHLI